MSGISGWRKQIGLQAKLQILIQGMLIVILVAAQLSILHQFELQVLNSAEERAIAVADGTINGLNTLMITKAGDEEVISDKKSRLQFIEKMGATESVKEMRVFRDKQLDSEYPPAPPQELPVDEMDRNVLASGRIETRVIRSDNGDATLRTVVPFIGKKNFRTINCLKCHGVNEGAVLGGASVTIDIKNDLATLRKINTWIWIGQGVLQIVLFFVVGLIVRRLLKQLGGEPVYVIDIVRRIAQGDLSGEIATRPHDDSSLLAAVKQMQGGLKAIIGRTMETADKLTTAARQLTASAQHVLQASERQTDSSASVAAAFEEMNNCIGQISENASDAQQHANETGQLAREGSGVVHEVVAKMDKISAAVTTSSGLITSLGEHSGQISNIVKVIKEIADQTNLLALNAAIEAARAGEQGRGFAVVAGEVGKLAERTTLSTQEIAIMIQTIQDGTVNAVEGMAAGNVHVDEGVHMAGQAGNSMERIQEGVEKVLTAVDDISASLREQAAASTQITRNIEGIARMTEETSDTIKNVTAAADQLELLAIKLKESVGQFRL